MYKDKNIKGIRIRTLNFIMLFLSLFLFAIVFFSTVQISREYRDTIRAMDNFIKWNYATTTIQTASNYLTEQAKLYATTLKPEYADNYFKELYVTRNREKALETLSQAHLHEDSDEHDCGLKKALDLSNALVHREVYVIRLIAEATKRDSLSLPPAVRNTRLTAADRVLSPEEKIERARDMMFSRGYQTSKNEILSTLNDFLQANLVFLKTEQENQSRELGDFLFRERIMLIILCFLNILTFAMIIILIVKPLKIYLTCIKRDKMLEVTGAYEFKHLALTYNDIFALKEHNDKLLKHQAEHDPLTGLLNRSAFDALRKALKDSPQTMAFLLIDVDKFKEVNDTYGHQAGDAALRKVADILRHNFRSDDYCIRLGGDEFAVLIPGSSPEMEPILLKKVETMNRDLSRAKDDVPALSISVGGAFSAAGFADNLYRDADKALYEVKEGGRRGCRFFHPTSGAPEEKIPPL